MELIHYADTVDYVMKFILWVLDLEITYKKPVNIDLVVDFLHNVNISWTTKFNN